MTGNRSPVGITWLVKVIPSNIIFVTTFWDVKTTSESFFNFSRAFRLFSCAALTTFLAKRYFIG